MDKLVAELLSKCPTDAIRKAALNCIINGMPVADVIALIDSLS